MSPGVCPQPCRPTVQGGGGRGRRPTLPHRGYDGAAGKGGNPPHTHVGIQIETEPSPKRTQPRNALKAEL